jgi:hypothetical protein
LTAGGRKQLHDETTKWDKLAGAIARILRPAGRTLNKELIGNRRKSRKKFAG